MFNRIIICLSLLLTVYACRKDEKFHAGEGSLTFSKSELFFDTVFTRLPGSAYPRSVNKRFMVRNPYKESVSVNVRIMGGSSSVYRMNADGRTGRYIPGLEILAGDSAWVFVEATLEANNLNNPLLVTDSIEFETGGNRQYVKLSAYGWDAYYLKDTVFSGNTNLTLSDKPYVIVNTAFVDENSTLSIGPGLHFYCTPNSVISGTGGDLFNIAALNVLGTLKISGSAANPVVFEGDRLEDAYKDRSGQWRGIRFYRGSINNEIDYALIKNGTIGIRVDSLPESGIYNLKISHTTVKNMSAYGVLGVTAKLSIDNTLIYNCGINTFLGYFGGDYSFRHCTFHTSSNGRRDPHMVFNNVMRDENKVIIRKFDLLFSLQNSIVWGPLETEIGFDIVDPPLSAVLNFNIIKAKTSLGGVSNQYNKDPKFQDIAKGDFKPKADSPAKDAGDPNNSLFDDIDGKTRSDGLPDMGAYEL